MTRQTIQDIANQLPAGWIEQEEVSAEVLASLKFVSDWLSADTDFRKRQIADAINSEAALAALYLMWNWESDANLRCSVVIAIIQTGEAGAARLLRRIMLHEPPDDLGKQVRNQVYEVLTRRRGAIGRVEETETAVAIQEFASLRHSIPWF